MWARSWKNINHLLGYLLVAAGLIGCGAQGEESALPIPPPQVDVAKLEIEEVVLWDSFTGRVAAPETVDIRPRVSGYIEKLEFTEGQLVKQGDVLFVIDQRPYQAREQHARAELAQVQSQLDLASSEAARAKNLWHNRAISDEEFERRRSAVATAKAAVSAADAALRGAQLDLEYTLIKSPIAGQIGRANLTRGNLVTADVSVLTTVVSMDPLYVYFESDQVTAQSNPHNAQDRIPVRIRLDNTAEDYYAGYLDFVDNRYHIDTGTLQYRAVVPNPDHHLKPGQFARVDMPITAAQQTLLLDQKAVLTDQDRRYVYVLDHEDKAQRRFVEVGRHFNGMQVVRDGLQPGERVVVNGLQKIAFPGMPVSPQLVDMQRHQDLPMVASSLAD